MICKKCIYFEEVKIRGKDFFYCFEGEGYEETYMPVADMERCDCFKESTSIKIKGLLNETRNKENIF